MSETMNRREFTVESALAILGGVAITISGCSGGSSGSPTAPTPAPTPPGGVSGTISGNHGHTATITSAQLTAGNSISLNIQGAAPHPHVVDLTQSDIGEIRDGRRVTKTSSMEDLHAHAVTFN